MIHLINKDFNEYADKIKDNSVDLIITDPPYAKKYFYCYEYLAKHSKRILKSGGSLLVIVPHYNLENIVDLFKGELKYRWVINLNQFSGSHARLSMGIEIMWKPMLWYVKDAFKFKGFIRDGVEIKGKEGQRKKLHKWQQDEDWCKYYIRLLCPEGGLVFDPYFGSGTVAKVCKDLNRNFIGTEIDKDACDTAFIRIF
jgi:DNA modification methylase